MSHTFKHINCSVLILTLQIGLKEDVYRILEQERLCMLDYSRWKATSRLAEMAQDNIGALLGRPDIFFEDIADIIRRSEQA